MMSDRLESDIRQYNRTWIKRDRVRFDNIELPSDLQVLLSESSVMQVPESGFEGMDIKTFNYGTEDFCEDTAENVRIVIDFGDISFQPTTESTDWHKVTGYHDFVFRYLKERTNLPNSFVLVVLGAWCENVMNPLVGLFTGFIKSVSLEFPSMKSRCVIVDSSDVIYGIYAAEHAIDYPGPLPTAGYIRGNRYDEGVVLSSLKALDSDSSNLSSDSIVVATGGSRGITAEIVRDIVATYGCEVHLIGSSDISKLLESAAEIPNECLTNRSSFIRYKKRLSGDTSVALISSEFDKICSAKNTIDLIKELEAFSGPGKVRYHNVDVRDRNKLKKVVEEIESKRQVDLVIHGAGINRAANLMSKELDDFSDVRDIKAAGYLNLKDAFKQSPKRWFSFGSLIGLTGQYGETDYAGANDMLAASACFEFFSRKIIECCIGWTLWRDVGMGSSDIHHSFFSKTRGGMLTLMPSSDGLRLFRRELQRSDTWPSVVHIGSVEADAIDKRAEHLLSSTEFMKSQTVLNQSATRRGAFYIDEFSKTEDSLTAYRIIDGRDEFLKNHSVNGIGTLPGCFVVELVSEAAMQLHPGLLVVGIRDLKFESFVRLDGPSSRSPLRINAVTREVSDESLTLVDVVIDSEIRTKEGRLLSESKKYYTATVLLSTQSQPAPAHKRWPVGEEMMVVDPYHMPQSPVFLGGEFKSTTNTRVHPLGKRADYFVEKIPKYPYSKFCFPVLLLDGLIRLAVIEPIQGRYLALAVPTQIAQIDFWTDFNDLDLQQLDRIELYSTPRGIGTELADNSKYWAVDQNGHVILQVCSVRGAIFGYIDGSSGRILRKSEWPSELLVDQDRGVVAL